MREMRRPDMPAGRGQDRWSHLLFEPPLIRLVDAILGSHGMNWTSLIIILLLLGPLRRPFFRNWRFTVPATLAGIIAWMIISGTMKPGEPCWMTLGIVIMVALGAGAAFKEWFDEVFGKEK